MRFPVTVAAYDGNALTFKIEFNRCRLDEATVRRMLGHFRQLLEGLAVDPMAAIRDLPLITEAERQELMSVTVCPAPQQIELSSTRRVLSSFLAFSTIDDTHFCVSGR